jgi:hypothetical protein
MASFRARRASAIERTDLYQDITDRIIIQLEQGRVPWVQPWDSAAAALDLPVNASTLARPVRQGQGACCRSEKDHGRHSRPCRPLWRAD